LADAEDLVQDAYLRWRGADHELIKRPRAWLTTATTRLCLDFLKSARRQREEYVGPWLPEPILTDEPMSPLDTLETADNLSMAFMVILERLSPVERAAFLLKDVFDYDFREISRILNKSEIACRQSASRARARLRDARPRYTADEEDYRRLASRFQRALQDGEMNALIHLFVDDIEVWTDGGGKAIAALNVIHGADKAARFFAGLAKKIPGAMETVPRIVNGRPGYVSFVDGRPYFVLSFDVTNDKIRSVQIMRNPDKLSHVRLH
jgi:RNA polymerase sigma-70 factor (ECF subfamily)